jgi:drug/metabolite transporter (DMT)-like permease
MATRTWVGLAFLYVVWGAGYPAAAVMLESIPPLLGMAGRSLVAGAVLLAIACARSSLPAVAPRELGWAAVVGIMLLLTNGLIVVGQQEVPAGIAALIAGSLPLWVVVLQPGRAALRDAAGVAAGFAGLALLVAPGGIEGGTPLGAVALIVAATAVQAGGTLMAQRVPLPADPFTMMGVGMVAAALGLGALGVAAGEAPPSSPEASALLAWLFLAGPVAIGGYLTFTWLLRRLSAVTVSTYAYVNPVVALLLAWALLGETVTGWTLAGAALILAAVASVLARPGGPDEAGAEPSPRARRRLIPRTRGSRARPRRAARSYRPSRPAGRRSARGRSTRRSRAGRCRPRSTGAGSRPAAARA